MPIEVRELHIRAVAQGGARALPAALVPQGHRPAAQDRVLLADGTALARLLRQRGVPAHWHGDVQLQGAVTAATGAGRTGPAAPGEALAAELRRGGLAQARVVASPTGARIRGHELTHLVQQRPGGPRRG